MLHLKCITDAAEWLKGFGHRKERGEAAGVPLERPSIDHLASQPLEELPLLVRQAPTALRYLKLLGDLDWSHFPERPGGRAWPGPKPAPRAPFVGAYLVKLEEGQKYMSGLRNFLLENPALVWLLGFPLQPDDSSPWGFDVEASLPSRKQLGRVLRTLRPEQTQYLLECTVKALDVELPEEVEFGSEISVDTKHIIAWVKENNPKVRVSDRFDKTRQPSGDPDCKLGFKARGNQKSSKAEQTTARSEGATPSREGIPASQKKKGEYYWGYASGVVATKVDEWGEFVLAELTQTFDQSDASYFLPLMAQTEQMLGRKPTSGALDAAYDNFFVHQYFAEAGGMAAVPWADRADHHKSFSEEGLPLCEAGLAMPLKSTFQKRSHCLVPHECGRYACPCSFPESTGEPCPIEHKNWEKGGCITTLPTCEGARRRHQLDRESDEYKRLYKQRTATERINGQAVELGIERPRLRNRQAIANQNTLLYVLINLRALQRVRKRKRALNDLA